MTTAQRTSIFAHRWPAACRTQGWDANDRALRLRVISEAVKRPIQSMGELDNKQDIDDVFAHLGMLADRVLPTVETLPVAPVTLPAGRGAVTKRDTAGERRRILWLIRQHARPLGGEPYILALPAARHITIGISTIEDLPTVQLHQLMITLNARRIAKQEPDLVADPFLGIDAPKAPATPPSAQAAHSR